MNVKTTIRKLLFIGIWLCISAAMFILLLAAIGNKNKVMCRDYVINIKSVVEKSFTDKNEIEQLLKKKIGGKIKGMPVAAIKLQELELALEKNQWIKNAELYFDNKDILHVAITEKNPVARMFTTSGNSFYIDDAGDRMPLSDQYTARVLVFTGFPDFKKLSEKDSALLTEVTALANYIYHDPFWMSQIAQIDITKERLFEMIPEIGNNIIKIGNGEQIDQKLRRLYIFYQQVLSKSGFNKYKVIDVQYNGQVVASGEDASLKVDQDQYKKNVAKLIEESNATMNALLPKQPVVAGKYNLQKDSADTPVPEFKEKEAAEPQVKKNEIQNSSPNPLNSVLSGKNKDKTNVKTKTIEKQVPKAVMPKKTDQEQNQQYN